MSTYYMILGAYHIFGIAPAGLSGPLLQYQKNGTHPMIFNRLTTQDGQANQK